MAILDRIKFDGLKSRDWIVYKYPSEALRTCSTLIVSEGQVAIFVKGGQVCDVFPAGTYELATGNLPILSRLINLPYGGQTPFTAEIYFVNAVTKLDITWGTSDPIQLVDPKYFVKLRVRAFGQMGLKLKQYDLFFKELIGGMSQSDIVSFEKVKLFYRGLIITKVKTMIADTIINDGISALEINTQLDTISTQVKEKIEQEFEKYGFYVPNFYIQSINFPDEDFAKINSLLEDRAAFEIMGDGRYATKRTYDVYESAAQNENGVAGALLTGGVGIGMGVGLAGTMGRVVPPPQTPEPMQICSACRAEIKAGQKFCPECGAATAPPKVKCPKCGQEAPGGVKFCPECGSKLAVTACECGCALQPGVKFCPECGKKVGS